ncbi:hypothetical protein [Mucilaginibacter flavus]|uniref:hypothetical protein n=1 Tax=Mucilaginibacter flavus TaxID=931504 RepID=UPI0025B3F081|nr:hypothetical protein [Mucilaginibacter flavus]MDN3583992.1 hypothetical protein [Mucilaginibacter flavus]
MKSNLLKSLFNKHIKKHLKSTDWKVKNHLLYAEITSGLLKGFYFNSSGFSADQFEIVTFVLPMYVPKDYVILSFGYFLPNPIGRQWWNYTEDKLEQLGEDIANVVNQAEKSFLNKINNAADFYNHYKSNKKKEIPFFEAVSYSAVYGELAISDEELNGFISYLKKQKEIKFDWVQEVYHNTEKLLAGNRKEILAGWEMETRKALKL